MKAFDHFWSIFAYHSQEYNTLYQKEQIIQNVTKVFSGSLVYKVLFYK